MKTPNSAQPADEVAVTDVGADGLGDQLQHLVAAVVAEAVVDGLEVIGIDDEQGEAVGMRDSERGVDLGGEGATVQAIGEPVGGGEPFEFAVGLGELGRSQLHIEHGGATQNDRQDHRGDRACEVHALAQHQHQGLGNGEGEQ